MSKLSLYIIITYLSITCVVLGFCEWIQRGREIEMRERYWKALDKQSLFLDIEKDKGFKEGYSKAYKQIKGEEVVLLEVL